MLTRFDVAISPINCPLEQYIIEVDAIGIKAAEKFAEECFKGFKILCISAHNERKPGRMTIKEKAKRIYDGIGLFKRRDEKEGMYRITM